MSDRLLLGHAPDTQEPYELKPKRLRTHGVVVGMTGSGKTGLSLVLLEELVQAGVPIIAIDPKGDLGNLALVFPDFGAADFAPWCGSEDPAEISSRWKAGVEKTGLSQDTVRTLRDGMDLTLYTPGSRAGVPVNVLGAFERPPADVLEDDEARRDRVSDRISGLFGLVGRAIDPIQDPGHVVMSHILETAWLAGEDPDLATLVLRLVDPPFERVGVFPVDRFFKPDDRMKLAVSMNAVMASPSFSVWSEGVDLDPQVFLQKGDKTKVSVFCLSHLADSERQFFISMLLSQVLGWSRTQPGSEDLRALVFFDEVAGYLPPHPKNPPTKAPLLTLMKQARAVGLGVVVATQNPVDLDYKALSNAGLWCIGRLSTPQDRKRLLQGMGDPSLDDRVAGLEKRQFLLHMVGRGEPATVNSRHAMCYLRGPLTRVEIERLTPPSDETTQPTSKSVPTKAVEADDTVAAAPSVEGLDAWYVEPALAFNARQDGVFADRADDARDDGNVLYQPALFAQLRLRFDEDRVGYIVDEELVRIWYPLDGALEDPLVCQLSFDDLSEEAPDNARFAPLPEILDQKVEIKRRQKDVLSHIYREETRMMFVNKKLKLTSTPDETAEAFNKRCETAAAKQGEDAADTLRDKFQVKGKRLEDKIEAKRAKLAEQEGAARASQLEEAVNVGETLLGMFGFGRKKSVSSAMTKRRRSARAAAKVEGLQGEIERLEEDAEELVLELDEALEELEDKQRDLVEATTTKEVRLEKADIELVRFGIVWVPATRRPV